MSDEPLVIVPAPPLLFILQHHERQKGSPLTEAEVLAIRDGAPSMALPAAEARTMAQARGFDDIPLDDPWPAWQAVRASLGD